MDFIVAKFGGSSVASAERIRHVADIVLHNDARRCVVVSAPGKAHKKDTKVTDMLIALVEKARAGEDTDVMLQAIRQRYIDIYTGCGLPQDTVMQALEVLDAACAGPRDEPGKFRDRVVACGEDINARLFAAYLDTRTDAARYVSPRDIKLHVSSEFGNAVPLDEAAIHRASLKKTCAESVVVFPGFYGITPEGDVATFSRGGSDLTGALLAEAIEAAEYENWSDVDGIFCCNPTIVDNPMQIPALTYREMRELSYIGFTVFHEEAVQPTMRTNIPIRLRNTNNLDNKGTLIVSRRLPSERDVIGIASGGEYCSFTIEKFLMNRQKGVGRRLFGILEQFDLSFEHCPSGLDNMSVVLDQSQLTPELVNSVVREIQREIVPDHITTEFGLSLVSVVGEGLLHKVGILGRTASALAAAGVNIKMVNQGSSELSIIFGIDASDEKKAVQALYQTFFEKS
jgi:aspartate kinase